MTLEQWVSQLSWHLWSTDWSDRSLVGVEAVRLSDDNWVLTDGYRPTSFMQVDGGWDYNVSGARRFTLDEVIVAGEPAVRALVKQRCQLTKVDPASFRVSATGRPTEGDR